MKKYTHIPLNQEVRSISGGYTLLKEVRMPVGNEMVFYTTGVGFADTACCGTGGGLYVLVIGIIEKWHAEKDEKGNHISYVNRISSKEMKEEIIRMISAKERGAGIQFL